MSSSARNGAADGRSAPSKAPFIVAFGANLVVAAAKFVAAFITGSSAMLAEGFHSTVDGTNNLLMLFGIRQSRRAPTREHPFGHGKELYFWSLIVAVVIFGVGGGVSIYEGATRLVHTAELRNPVWNYAVLLVSLVADGVSLVFAYRAFEPHRRRRGLWRGIRSSKDPTKFTVLLEDGAATTGIFIAGLGVWLSSVTGQPRYDAAASVLIGLLLAAIATVLARESKGLLLGESASEATVSEICRTVEADVDVEAVRNVLTMHLGPSELLLNLDVEFAQDLGFPEIAEAVERLEATIRSVHPEVRRIFIEARSLRGSSGGSLRRAP